MNDPFADARRRREAKQRQEEIERRRQEQLQQQWQQDQERQRRAEEQKMQQDIQELTSILEIMKVHEKLSYIQQVAWQGYGTLEFTAPHYDDIYGDRLLKTGWQLSFKYHHSSFSVLGGWQTINYTGYSGKIYSSYRQWKPEEKYLNIYNWQEALEIYSTQRNDKEKFLVVDTYRINIFSDKSVRKDGPNIVAFIEVNDLVVATQQLDDALFEYVETTKGKPSPVERQRALDIQSQQAIEEYNRYKPRIREPGKWW